MEAVDRGASALRDVGHRALYIAGVVPRSLDRTPMNVRYVASIGTNAYREVGGMLPGLTVFKELAESFETVRLVVGDATTSDEHEPAASSTSRSASAWWPSSRWWSMTCAEVQV